MKKKLALMLATLTTVASLFTGCGEKDVTGNYVANVQLAQFMEESDLQSMDEMGLDVSSLSLDVTLDLTKDKEFTFDFDTTGFKSDFSALLENNMDGLIDAGLAESGVTRDDITDEIAQYSGYDSADALFEDLKNQIMGQMDTYYEELDNEMKDASVTGTYKVSKDSVIFVTEDGDDVSFDKATINDDGSISLDMEFEGKEFTLDFQLQK
ncbi:MAG: hypothetical protein IJS76_06550 [Pseudobutyrivibrio sp.]|nr:hypothetical protein [Pseudobutyrivibrio sp.]